RQIVLEHKPRTDMAQRCADLRWPTPMQEAIGRACIDDERSHIWRRIAGPLVEIDEPRMRPRGISPEFPPLDRTDRTRDFDTFADYFAGKVERRGIDRNEDVALDDVVERDGPLRPVVPELLLGAGFVETRAAQF